MPLLRLLPAVPAISAIASVPAIASATSAASATAAVTAPAATTAAVAAATASATAAFGLRSCFVHYQVSSAEVLSVHRIHRAIGIIVAVDFNEREAARLPGETVTDQINIRGGYTDLREPFMKLFFRCRKRKVPDIELLHLPDSFCPEPNSESRGERRRDESRDTGSPR